MTGHRLLIRHEPADQAMQSKDRNLCETISLEIETKARSRTKPETAITDSTISDFTISKTTKKMLAK